MKRYVGFFLTISFLIDIICPVLANDQSIILGKDENWAGIVKKEGLITRQGRGGYSDLILKDSEYTPIDVTDLLLHFNETPFREESSHYSVTTRAGEVNRNYAKLGDGCGVFQGEGGLMLVPRAGALFAPKTTWSDFTCEFWLYPASMGEGESICLWKGFRMYNGKLVPQKMECRIQNRSLVWAFDNFFYAPNEAPFQFEIKNVEKLIPRQWHHHMLRFESATGIIEYLVDGIPAGTRYATLSGKESGSSCYPSIGESENTALVVGDRFTGFLDEFRLSRELVKNPRLGRYPESQGRATSRVFDLGYSGTIIKRIDAIFEKPRNSEINFYIRCSDTFNTTDRLKEDWIPFLPGTSFQGTLKGRYLQIMVEFFPDGKNEVTPRLFEVSIVFQPDLPPVGPIGLVVKPGNSKVTVSWKRVNEEGVKGYFLFYGEAPLNYQGEDAKEGMSPINVSDVTSFELTGLKNGKLYYFAVAAYDSSTPPQLSDFIEEKSTRPSEALK
jgi:hypothetical protein